MADRQPRLRSRTRWGPTTATVIRQALSQPRWSSSNEFRRQGPESAYVAVGGEHLIIASESSTDESSSQQRWEINSVWYLGTTGEFDALGAATGQASASNEESDKKIEDLEAREAALSSRESDVQNKDKQLQERENELTRRTVSSRRI